MTVTPQIPGGTPGALLVEAAEMSAAPGTACLGQVTVTNAGPAPAAVSLQVVGLDPSWVELPPTGATVLPGEVQHVAFRVTVPAGHPPCRLVGQLEAEDNLGRTATSDLALVIADGTVLSISVDPPEVRGGAWGRAAVVLRNRGRSPVRAELAASAPDPNLRVRLRSTTEVLQPGAEVRVRAKLSAKRPVTGPARRPFVVTASTGGTPVSAEANFTQRPVLAPWLTKAGIILLVVALWVAAAAVGITSLNHHLNRSATNKAAQNSPNSVAPSPNDGSGSGGSGGSGSGGASGSGGGASAAGGAAAAAAPFGGRISGKVTAPNPGGVTVTVTPSSLSAAGGSGAGGATLASAPIPSGGPQVYTLAAASSAPGKLYGAALPAGSAPPKANGGATSLGTTTAPDGSWSLEGITTPGYYQVTFSKAGYATASYVVNVPLNGKPVTLAARMVTGDGGLSGTVTGPAGPLGGVTLTITDGTVNLTTRTPTVGNTGAWSVRGLTTPDTYLITATLPGYGTATSLVTLAAGGSSSGNAISMTPGVGSLSGLIVSAASSAPLGGVTVTATDASVSRTTTTTTTGPIGTYSLPDLPVPGTYAVTVSGPGWISQTQQVNLSADPALANATVNARLTSSGSDVSGVASDTSGKGLAGAGVTLANADNTYKTLTTSAAPVGSFDFGQVVPGQYVLTVVDFGYTTKSAQVTVGPGQATTVNLALPYVGASNVNTATVTGSIESLLTAKAIAGAQISLDGQPTGITTSSTGTYQLTGVAPGVHSITAACPIAKPCQSLDLASNTVVSSGYETTTVSVTVALGAAAFAPALLMPTLDRLAGVVLTVGGAPVPNPVVTLSSPGSGVTYAPNPTPTASGATPAQGGFEFDGLPHGTYTLQISGPPGSSGGPCPTGSIYQSASIPVTMPTGTDILLSGPTSPRLNVEPLYSVKTFVVPADGSPPVLTAGVTVSLTDENPAHSITFPCQSTDTVTQIPLPAADAGDQFVANFTYTAGGTTYTAPQSQPFTDQVNNNTVDTALLVPPSPSVTLTLKYAYRSATGLISCAVSLTAVAPCPTLTKLDLPTVSITGTYATGGGNTVTKTVAASTSGNGVWTWAAPPGTPPTELLEPGPVTESVSGGAFYGDTVQTATTTTGFNNQALLLGPLPTGVTGVVSPATGSTITVSPALSGLSVTTGPTGDLVWNDSASSPGSALPGVYSLYITHPGYDPATVANIVIEPCHAPPCVLDLGTIALTAHVELDVTPQFNAAKGMPYPTVVLTDHTGAQVRSVTLSAGAGTADFPDLSVTGNPYTVTILAPGFHTFTESGISLSQPVTTLTPAPVLIPEGWFTGTVKGSINSGTPAPLAGVTVTAALQNANGCTYGVPKSLSAVTDSSGDYTLIPDPASGDGGVCAGSSWTVTATPPHGYAAATPVNIASVGTGANSVDAVNGGPITLAANQLNETFTVEGFANALLPGVSVIGSSPLGRTVTGKTGADGKVTLTIDPTSYSFTFTLAQYNPLTVSIVFGVGEPDQTATVTMSLHQNTIKGQITTPNPGGGACGTADCPMGGMNVALIDGNGSTAGTGTTASDGTYSIPSILDGGYTLEVTNLGSYSYATGSAPSFATNPSGTTIQNVSVVANPRNVTVGVTSNINADQTGNTVSLVPTQPPAGESLTCSDGSKLIGTGNGVNELGKVASGKVAISGVVPDFYSLTVTGPSVPQQGTASLLVCPGTAVEYYAPGSTTASDTATFQVQEGQLTGKVAVVPGDGIAASDVTVTVTPTGGSNQLYSVSCSDAGCDQGTWTSAVEALGQTYTVLASTSSAGYGTDSATSTLSATSPPTGPTSVGTLNVDPSTRSVTLTVTDASSGTPVPNALVTLTDSRLSQTKSNTTDATGAVTISGVEPDNSASYAISVSVSGTNLAPSGAVTSVSVPVGSGTVSGGTVTVPYYGSISGTLAEKAIGDITVSICDRTPCTGGHVIETTTGSGSGSSFSWSSGALAPGTYYVEATAGGGGTVSPSGATPVTIGPDGSVTANFTYTAPPPTTTTTVPPTTTTTVPPTTTTTVPPTTTTTVPPTTTTTLATTTTT